MTSFKLDAIEKQIHECQIELKFLSSGGAGMFLRSVNNSIMQSQFADQKKELMMQEIDKFLGGDMDTGVVEECYSNLISLLSGNADLRFTLPCVRAKSLQEDYDFFSSLAVYIFPKEVDRSFENAITGTGVNRKLSIIWRRYNICIEICPDFAGDRNHVIFKVNQL